MPKITELTKKIEGDFLYQVDQWFSKGMGIWDDELDKQIHKWYANVGKVWGKKPYFSPSSLNSCPRELYLKSKGAKRDELAIQPHQGRWQRLGGLGGDMLQREILMMERHYEDVIGEDLKFKFYRDNEGRPLFEEFAAVNKQVEIDGEEFYLFGMPDGIMEYTDDDGKKYRVGLEIKSKQTTNARTSAYSMREAEESHVIQTVAYSEMYSCDIFLIVYINYSKKSWVMSDEEYEKTPDLRAFCMEISDKDRFEAFMFASDIRKSVKGNGDVPKLNLDKWTFNNYKKACANDLSKEELQELHQEVQRVQSLNLPLWQKNKYKESFNQILELRDE